MRINRVWQEFQVFVNLLKDTFILRCYASYLKFEPKNLNEHEFCCLNMLVGLHKSMINTILMFQFPRPPPPTLRPDRKKETEICMAKYTHHRLIFAKISSNQPETV